MMNNYEIIAKFKVLDEECRKCAVAMSLAGSARTEFVRKFMQGWAVWAPDGPRPPG